MSFKRKNTKPTRVFDIPWNLDHSDSTMHSYAIDDPQENINHITSKTSELKCPSTDYFSTNGNQLEHQSTDSCCNNFDSGALWQLSISLPNDSLSLPTMVNSINTPSYKWMSNFSCHNLDSSHNSSIKKEQPNDMHVSTTSTVFPPPKKNRKIRYKYQEGSQVDVKYRCEICQYCTNRSDHYKRHLITHSADKPLKCSTCGYGTGRSDHFRRHLSRHGFTPEEITKQCESNGIKTGHSSRSHFRNGQQTDSDSNIFSPKCPISNNGTISPADEHVAGFQQKRFACVQCGYSTDRINHYTRHIKTHSNEKPFRCEACGKNFKLESYLKKHRCPVKRYSSPTSISHLSAALPDTQNSTSNISCFSPTCGSNFKNIEQLTCNNVLHEL